MLCGLYAAPDVQHILFECHALAEVRTKYWCYVINECPVSLARCMQQMNSPNRAVFILSGFRSQKLVSEWLNIYKVICDFVYHIQIEAMQQFSVV